MQPHISELKTQFQNELSQADLTDEASVENLRLKYLGKKGLVTELLKGMGSLSAEERPLFGKQ
ncbi:MAG: hypothetical protein LBQ76_00800, partial [Candidatus Fibromonas sp.]|nr:hypothetical protein [Candidatus Fibromonas sp.]